MREGGWWWNHLTPDAFLFAYAMHDKTKRNVLLFSEQTDIPNNLQTLFSRDEEKFFLNEVEPLLIFIWELSARKVCFVWKRGGHKYLASSASIWVARLLHSRFKHFPLRCEHTFNWFTNLICVYQGLNNAGHPLLVLYFRVKFYVDSHLLIRFEWILFCFFNPFLVLLKNERLIICRDRVTRQHYYYQLRENVLRHGQPATEESFFRLAALALQAELGDYDPERHRAAYFDTQLYFPQWVK